MRLSPVLALAAGMFVLGVDAYVVAGLLPAIAVTFHASAGQAGQTVTMFTLCYALAAPVCALRLAGKPVRTVLALALVLFAAANAASALAPSLALLLAARAAAGIGAGIFSPVAVAAAASLAGERRKGRALGLALAGMGSGTVVGVPLGLWLASLLGWQGTLWFVAILALAALACIAWRLPDMPAAAPVPLRERLTMLLDARVAATVLVTFLAAAGSLGLYTYVAPIVHQLAPGSAVEPYFWAWGLGGVGASAAVGTLIDRTGSVSSLMAAILACLAAGLVLLPEALPHGAAGYAAVFVWGAMGWACVAPQQHALLSLGGRQGAAAVALNSSANYLGGAAGAALGAMAIPLAGLAGLPLFAASAVLLALAVQATIVSRSRRMLAG